MTAFWPPDPGYDPGPDAIEITGWGDRQRTFIERGPLGAVILPPEPHGIIHRPREPSPGELAELRERFLREAGNPVVLLADATPVACRDCGMEDLPPDGTGRCRYCGELAVLRARNLAGPPLSAWWHLLPGVLSLALSLTLAWAILYAVFYGLCRRTPRVSGGKYLSSLWSGLTVTSASYASTAVRGMLAI